ncbi:MAG: RecX family transcriptional regulator [Oscillospiraceae bacterium]
MSEGYDLSAEIIDNEVKISRIGETKKGRFSLFTGTLFKEDFLFSVDGETLAKYKIKEGSLLSGEELRFIRQTSDTRKAKDKALTFLSLRDYSRKELYDKLLRKFEPENAECAVAQMEKLGLIDDEKFARHRVSYLIRNNKSKREIFAKLSQLGIKKDIICGIIEDIAKSADGETVDEYGNEIEKIDEKASIKKLVEKSYISKLANGKQENVTAALLRRGFNIRDVKEVLSAYVPQEENEFYEEIYEEV